MPLAETLDAIEQIWSCGTLASSVFCPYRSSARRRLPSIARNAAGGSKAAQLVEELHAIATFDKEGSHAHL